MKQLFIILLSLVSLQSLSQTTLSADRVVTKSLYVRDWWVDSVKRDTANWQFSPRSIPTSKAVYDFVQGRNTGGGGSSSLASASDAAISSPTSGQVLAYNGTKWANTNAAKFQWTGLKNWDKIRASISGGDTTFVNYSTTYTPSTSSLKMLVKDTVTGQEYHTDIPTGSGSASIDTIQYAAAAPLTGSRWFNTLNHHLYLKNDEGTQWIGYAPSDSIAITSTSSGYSNIAPFSGADLTNSANVWTVTAGGASWGHTGLSSSIMGAGTTCSIRQKRQASDGFDAILGLNYLNAAAGYGSMQMGFWWASDGTLYRVDNGGAASMGVTVAVGEYVGIFRSGSTFTLRKSTDGTTWGAVLFTFTYTTSNAMYIVCDINGDGKMYDPEGEGLN